MGKRNQESLSGRGAQGLSFFKMLLIDLIVIPPILYGAEFFLRSPGIPLGSKLLLCLMTATGTKIVFRIIERLRGKGDARPASYHHSGGIWMTNVGFAATLLIILIGGAALNTGTNLLYLMLSTLLSFWSISGAMSWVNMRGLEVARRLPSEVHANTPAEIGYDLRNKKRRLASYGLTLMDNAAGLEPERPSVNFLAILPGRKDRIPARVKFLRRGWAEFSAIHVISSFPFGFLEYSRRKPLPARILVYPELVPVERMLSRRAIELGMEDSPVKGHGSNLYSIR
ncbi:hypothetical protein HYR69_01940, partial [Candidatus Sumerlaeota bacterium]|nr:hypothetical protein [Candidatus Sumerlaeota bacterium]